MKIRLAKLDDLQQVLNILNKVTLDLHKKGINQWDFPWDSNKIENDIMNNYSYVLIFNEKIIGTFCINDIDYLSKLSMDPQSKYLSKIAVLPEFQGNKYGSAITSYACYFSRKVNKTIYLDCWAGNEKLKDFYVKNSFEYLGDYPEEDYFISIFKFN